MKIVTMLVAVPSLLTVLTIPAMAGVTVNSPANDAQLTSPFNLSATSSTCGGHDTGALGYSLDGSSDTTIVDGDSVNASVVAPEGTHTLHVKAWGRGGGACVTDVTISVVAPSGGGGGGGTPPPPPSGPTAPSNAISVSNLEAMSNWKAQHDTGAEGSASGSMSMVTSPSQTGTSREFSTSFKNNGNERYELSWGEDTEATHFLYDAWVYIPSSAEKNLANLELDMNQVINDGVVVIMGFQCDGWNGTWDYASNVGSLHKTKAHWNHSSQKCNPRSWGADTWHHVQVTYMHDDSGKTTYQSVWLDGVEQDINATVNAAFGLGWGPSLITNFQVDGIGTGSNKVYMDNLTISRW
jgi:hypothetical protein